ncbi:MAG: hypothetical protein QW630_07485, partial [Sulfolobales archaeon]
QIDVWNADGVGLDPSLVGLVGSPTRVVKMWRIEIRRKGKIFTDSDVDVAIEKLLNELKKDGVPLGV